MKPVLALDARPQFVYRRLMAVGFLVAVILSLVSHTPDRGTHFWMFDSGQGDALMFQTNRTTQIVIDGGPSDQVLVHLGRIMPFWDRTIELVILSHPHADHLTGLIELARRYHIEEVWTSGSMIGTPEFAAWQAMLAENEIPVTNVVAGEVAALAGIKLTVLYPLESMVGQEPSQVHDATVVVRGEIGPTGMLLTGDLNENHEAQILDRWCDTIPPDCPALAADILKIPHHGSRTGLSQRFLEAVQPTTALISAGAGNPYGHPHASILEKLTTASIATYRTDTNGTVEIIFPENGELVIEKER